MKKIILAVVFILATISVANATVLTFEDLPDNTLLLNGYGGFNWSSVAPVYSIAGKQYSGTGYYNGTIGNISVFNGWGASPTVITLASPGTFTFNGAQFTSAFIDQPLTFYGLNNGILVYTSSTINIDTVTPTWVELDWSGLTQLQIFSAPTQWDMDNFTFNNGAAPVPEPSTILLFCAGFVWLGLYCRRSRTSRTGHHFQH